VYLLRDSFILDSGATVHVCNSCERFQSLWECDPDEFIYAGFDKILLTGVGAVNIIVKFGHVLCTIHLENEAYIPSFHTDVVSLRLFTPRNVY
jgi:hypothetical protein